MLCGTCRIMVNEGGELRRADGNERRNAAAAVVGVAGRVVGAAGAAAAGAQLVDGPANRSRCAPCGSRDLLRLADRRAVECLSAGGIRVAEHRLLLLPAVA